MECALARAGLSSAELHTTGVNWTEMDEITFIVQQLGNSNSAVQELTDIYWQIGLSFAGVAFQEANRYGRSSVEYEDLQSELVSALFELAVIYDPQRGDLRRTIRVWLRQRANKFMHSKRGVPSAPGKEAEDANLEYQSGNLWAKSPEEILLLKEREALARAALAKLNRPRLNEVVRVYLETGSIKATAKALGIHRATATHEIDLLAMEAAPEENGLSTVTLDRHTTVTQSSPIKGDRITAPG